VSYLLDTNVMFRRFIESDPLHKVVKRAIRLLRRRGETIYITPQNLVEFRALATRPIKANGLGMTAPEAGVEAQEIKNAFPLLSETPAIYPEWEKLTDAYGIIGRQVYDARLVAVMVAHGVSYLLTLNTAHFARFSEITAIDPHDV
jgi:predicted nucleic acid-binding protein